MCMVERSLTRVDNGPNCRRIFKPLYTHDSSALAGLNRLQIWWNQNYIPQYHFGLKSNTSRTFQPSRARSWSHRWVLSPLNQRNTTLPIFWVLCSKMESNMARGTAGLPPCVRKALFQCSHQSQECWCSKGWPHIYELRHMSSATHV